jgi:hypothetical protein
MRFPSEKPACPSRRTPSAVRTESGRRQAEQGGKGCWDAELPDHDWSSCGKASIASQSLVLAETIPHALCARQEHVGDEGEAAAGGEWLIGSALVAHELQRGPPMDSAAGVARSSSGAAPSWCNSTLRRAPAWPWRCNSIGEARAADRNGNCGCWPHRSPASYHQLLGDARARAVSGLRGNATRHRAVARSPDPRSGQP